MTNITEALLALSNENFMAQKHTCILCGQARTTVQWISEDCPNSDQLRGLAHVFTQMEEVACPLTPES